MNLAVMQPYFFPYLGYFSLFDAADTFIVYDDVNYKKKGWINRNNFWSYAGPQLFTLPVQNASQNKKICELELADFAVSRKDFFDLLKHSYSKAPCYRETIVFLEDVFDCESKSLADFLSHSLLKTVRYLDISVEVVRNSVAPRGLNLSGEKRIIEIAKEYGATKYINAIGGKELYQAASFRRHGIKLAFLQHKGTNYSQFSENHTPNLSIIDALMFNSLVDVKEVIRNYELING